jgi:hypothetical protein
MKTPLTNATVEMRYALVRRAGVPSELLVLLAQDPEIYVRQTLVGRLDLPLEAIDILTRDEHSSVREHLASRAVLPETAWLTLVADPNPRVRTLVLRTPGVLPTAVLDLAVSSGSDFERALVAGRPELTDVLLFILAKDAQENVQLRVARRDQLPASAISALSLSPFGGVRSVLAGRLDLPPYVQERLQNDPVRAVQQAFAAAPKLVVERHREWSVVTQDPT